ncbi:hypothetical protein [Streptomyces sp. NBC_01477]|uniref:hypothetical protein n=1 Tax=Streptomyces sp. NBC_01477 TaxID=2976015 RepID=UPI002E31F649|nr:hypothetical protein [Streptomyces sp. NBC_01477]
MALEATVGDDGMVYIRETEQPDVVAVTTTAKWEAFVKGVMAGEFDHFAAGVAEAVGSAVREAPTHRRS